MSTLCYCKPGIWPITSTKDPTHLSPFRMFKQTLLASQESAIAGSPTVHLLGCAAHWQLGRRLMVSMFDMPWFMSPGFHWKSLQRVTSWTLTVQLQRWEVQTMIKCWYNSQISRGSDSCSWCSWNEVFILLEVTYIYVNCRKHKGIDWNTDLLKITTNKKYRRFSKSVN